MLVLYSGSVLLYEMEHRLVSFCEAGGGPGYKTFFAVKFVPSKIDPSFIFPCKDRNAPLGWATAKAAQNRLGRF